MQNAASASKTMHANCTYNCSYAWLIRVRTCPAASCKQLASWQQLVCQAQVQKLNSSFHSIVCSVLGTPAHLECHQRTHERYITHLSCMYTSMPDLDSSLDVFFRPRAPTIEGEGNGNGLLVSQASFHGSSQGARRQHGCPMGRHKHYSQKMHM